MNNIIRKKILATTLLFSFLIIFVSGCGSKENTEMTTTTIQQPVNVDTSPTEEPQITAPTTNTEQQQPVLESLTQNPEKESWGELVPVDESDQMMYVKGDDTRVRVDPSTDSEQIASLNKNHVVWVINKTNKESDLDWYQTDEGYFIREDLLSKEEVS